MKTTQMANWLVTTCLLAAHAASAETWYLQSNNNDGNLTTPSHWTNAVGSVASAFVAGDTYATSRAAREVKTPSSRLVFSGGELHLGFGSGYGQMNIYSSSLAFPLLALDRGTLAQQGRDGSTAAINGAISVIGAEGNLMRWLYNHQTMTFDASVSGETSAVLATHVRYVNGNSSGRYDRNETLVLAGDCSGYLGLVDTKPGDSVSAAPALADGEFYVKLILAANGFSMPGSIKIARGCALEVTAATATVGNLTLNDGSILTVPATNAGGLNVTGTLTFTPPQRLRAIHAVPADGVARKIDVLTAPVGIEINPANFVLEGDNIDLSFATLGVRTENRRQALTISHEPIVELTTPDHSSLARASGNDTDSIAWGIGSSWSNGETPAAGTNYVVKARNDASMYLRTPTRNANIVFPGRSLTIGTNCFLRIFQSGGYSFTVDDLRLMGGSEVDVGQNTYASLYGNVAVVSGEVRFGACNQTLTFYSPFSGKGDVWFSGPGSGTSTPQGTFILMADNPDFKGRMKVEYCLSDATYGSKREVLTVGSELQLGGRLDAFDQKALTLRKYGRLSARESFSLTTNYNRGVFVDGAQGGVINVHADKTLAFNTRLTLNGSLYKDGAGTLAMGGTVKFGVDSVDTPTEGANLFIVTNGTVKVTSVDSMNGLATTFASGTKLVLAVDPGNADLVRYGIRNVKTATPFTSEAGLLPLALEASDEAKAAVKGRGFRLGLLTVSASATNAVSALVPKTVRTPFSSAPFDVVEVLDDDNGWITYAIDFVPQGMTIIFK